jgi:hypothetical protein
LGWGWVGGGFHASWPMLLFRFISAMTERGCGTWGVRVRVRVRVS